MEQDSISDTERTTVTTAWNIPHANGSGSSGGGGGSGSPDENDALQRTSKKLSWNNGVLGSSNLLPKVILENYKYFYLFLHRGKFDFFLE